MTLVVDASVAIKWFVTEAGRKDALAIIDLKVDLVAPDIFRTEFTNVLRKKVLLTEITLEHAKRLIEIVDTFVTLVPTSAEISQSALTRAVTLNHPAYDCTYLACAEILGARFVTADQKFADRLYKNGLGHMVMRLGDFDQNTPGQLSISDQDLARIISFSERYEATIASVYLKLRSTSDRIHFISTSDMRPAWRSPTGYRLEAALRKLIEDELGDIVALGWLGRGYDGLNFSILRIKVQEMSAGRWSDEIPYVMSILQYVESGLSLLRSKSELSPDESSR